MAQSDIDVSGTITASQAAVGTGTVGASVTAANNGYDRATWLAQLSGTFSAGTTIQVAGSYDGGLTWRLLASIVGGQEQWLRGEAPGLTHLRAWCSALYSGDSITVLLTLSEAARTDNSQWEHARNTFQRPANTTAYSAGQVITATVGGAIQVPGVVRAAGGSAVITQIQLTDMVNATTYLAPLVYVFRGQPSVFADGAALALTAADHDLLIDALVLSESELTNASASPAGSRWYVARGFALPISPTTGTSAWVYVVATAAYTPVSGETFKVALGVNES